MTMPPITVHCPDCRAAYELAADAIGPRGRMVRCRACSHVWYEMPVAAPSASAAIEPVDAGEGGQEPAFDLDSEPPREAGSLEPRPSRALLPMASAPGKLLHAVIVDAETAERMRAAPRRPAAFLPPPYRVLSAPPAAERGFRRLAPLALAAAALVVTAAVVLRGPLVSALPSLGGLFAAAGLEVNLAGLEFRAVTAERRVERGAPILEVEAEITNVAGRDAKVPAVRIVVRKGDSQEVYSWLVEPSRFSLAAGETIIFRSRLALPPGGGEDVELRFAPRRLELAELH